MRRLRAEVEAKASELDRALEHARRLAAEAPGDAPGEGPAADARPPRVTEGLRTIVIQMKASGSSREEIAGRLEREFDVADADSVVGAVLDRE